MNSITTTLIHNILGSFYILEQENAAIYQTSGYHIGQTHLFTYSVGPEVYSL